MKNLWKITLTAIALLSALLVLGGCGKDDPDKKPDKGTHTCVGEKWVTEKEATCQEDGSKKLVCSCGKTVKTEVIPLGNHNLVNGTCTVCGISSVTEIRTIADLQNIASNLSGSYILMNDLDLGCMEWIPIGTDYFHSFTGTFDGNNHVISNFKITSDVEYVGLFGFSKGTIKNLGLECFTVDVSRSDDVYAGGLVGYNDEGTVANCYAKGNVSSTGLYANSGGLIGYNTSSITITNCYATGDVRSTSVRGACAGGLVGSNFGNIVDCYTKGDVSSTSENSSASAGGLIGAHSSGAITNCYAEGDISSSTSSNYSDRACAGGLVGKTESSSEANSILITDCYAIGDVSSTSSPCSATYAGGLVGYNRAYTNDVDITNCYATGGVSSINSGENTSAAIDADAFAGGLVGHNDSYCGKIVISNCSATGTVSCTSSGDDSVASAGGLIGHTYGSTSASVTIVNCYSMGDVSSTNSFFSFAGGLVGRDYYGTIVNCYATGDVSASVSNTSYQASPCAGGLVGYNDEGTIATCYATGDVIACTIGTGYDTDVHARAGGLVGYHSIGNITSCYATGDVSASSTSSSVSADAYTGGLVGENYYGIITNCYAMGDVSANSTYSAYAGGLVGYHYGYYANGTIMNSYAIGNVSSTSSETSTE